MAPIYIWPREGKLVPRDLTPTRGRTVLTNIKNVCEQWSISNSYSSRRKRIREALLRCNYPTWVFSRLQTKINYRPSAIQTHNLSKGHWTNSSNNNTNTHNIYIVVPYIKGLSKSFKNVCDIVGIQVHFKEGNTIRNLLLVPKDKDTIAQKSGVIYRFKCPQADCEEEYTGGLGCPLV